MQSKITLRRARGLINKTFLALCLLCFVTGALNAQSLVNGNLSTGPTTISGVAAPAGYTWSEVQPGNTNAGFGANIGAGLTLADNFVVPVGQNWNLTSITFYAYSTGYVGTTSPFNDTRIQIFNTDPSVGTPTPIFGNLTTNRFASSVDANMYRIFTTPANTPGTTRKIWEINATVNVSLPAGNYWIEWQHGTVTAGASNFSPASTVVGTATQPGNNAKQHTIATNTWANLFDGATNPQDMPFRVNYTTTCTDATAPTLSTSALNSCAGAPVTLTVTGGSLNNSPNWVWYAGSCGGTSIGTGNSIVVNPAVTTTYYARGEGGCTVAGPCGQITVNVTPCTCLTPDVATICQGAIQRLSVSGTGVPGTATVSSGAISVAVPDASAAGATSTLAVNLPAGASITTMSVTFTLTHTWDSDMRFNLVAPNGQILNLVNARGGSGNNFTNTTITSAAGAPSLATGVVPFTGTFAPDAAIGQGPTGFVSNATNFAALFGQTNGNWILAMRDVAGGDLGTLTSWSLDISYVVLPTATWTGGTIFTNPAATTPYVAGTQSNFVYVQPSATTTYTANISSGPCAGNNNVTVNVLPNPVVTVNPPSGCGPLTVTASGASTYAWTPSGGLSATTGATVTANPNTTTTYTVTGTATNTCKSTATVTVNSAPTASVISALASPTYQIQEGFATVLPAGWSMQNNSSAPQGTTTWFQGTAVFPAFNGPATSYAAANYQSTAGMVGNETLSTWLFTPVVNIANGDQISFYTRTVTGPTFADRLQVRLSTAGASTNVGTTPTSVGDFTTLLVEVNPTLVATSYPSTWTRYTGTVTGLAAPTTGRIAFRHFVTNGGPNGANSDFIGIDQVEYSTPPAFTCPNVVSNLSVNITGGVGPYSVVFTDGTTNTTINNYTSGGNIQVSPAATTTYTIVSVTGANGCVGTGNTGSALISVRPPASVTTQPANRTTCAGNNTTFTVASAPSLGNSFQWQISTDGGATYTNLSNAAPYSGVTTSTLTVTGATTAMSGYRYRVIVSGSCGAPVTSNAATLTVNIPAVITLQPTDASICANGSLSNAAASFTVAATGSTLTYQWQQSTDGGTTWTSITDGGSYSGSSTNVLNLNNVPVTFNDYSYRVLVASGGCTAVASDTVALTVNVAPQVNINLGPYSSLYPGLTTTLTAAVSPATPASTITWFRNGVAIPGATGTTLTVDVDGLGTYTASATDANGCSSMSNSRTITDSVNSIMFIYPSPNTGQFQVRYYSASGNIGLPRTLTIYDSKGAKVYTKTYTIAAPYTSLEVDMKNHAKGIYVVELHDRAGNRIKTGRVMIF